MGKRIDRSKSFLKKCKRGRYSIYIDLAYIFISFRYYFTYLKRIYCSLFGASRRSI